MLWCVLMRQATTVFTDTDTHKHAHTHRWLGPLPEDKEGLTLKLKALEKRYTLFRFQENMPPARDSMEKKRAIFPVSLPLNQTQMAGWLAGRLLLLFLSMFLAASYLPLGFFPLFSNIFLQSSQNHFTK